jgi:L-alanine-DL-glutamate epimerase-like enolase superfamily enzyme
MKISAVQSFLLSYPLREPRRLPFHGGERTIVKRDAMLVRIEADNGLVGYAPGPGSENAHRIIERAVGPFLEGRELNDIDALRTQFQAAPGADLELAKVYCAVEVALYDLLGKEREMPVFELLGGRVRDRIQVYGSAGMYMAPEGYAAEARRIAGLGFKAYKMRPALGPEQDLEAVRLMRQAVGPDMKLMVDAHSWWRMGDHSYDYSTVERLAREMAGYGVFWLEEPITPDDHAGYRSLREKGYLPIASGEHEPSEEGYLDLLASGSVDYVQMDVCCQGGYAMGQRIFTEIARRGVKFAFHSWGTALEVIAAAHLGVCWPATVVEWLEYPVYSTDVVESMYEFPLASEILATPLRIEGSDLILPKLPGLGVEIDESVIARYPWVPGPWSFFRLFSPAGTWAVTSDHSIKWNSVTGAALPI